MFVKYYKFHIITLLLAFALTLLSVLFNLHQTETSTVAMNIAIKAFAAVILFESMMIYYKILKVFKAVVAEITGLQVFFAIATYVMVFAGFCLLGLYSTASFALIVLAIVLRTVTKVNAIDSRTKAYCIELDEETRLLNEEIENGEFDAANFQEESCEHDCECEHDCSCEECSNKENK